MPLPPSSPPLTRAESSGYQHTSLHRDVLDTIESLRARGDNRPPTGDFGSSPEGPPAALRRRIPRRTPHSRPGAHAIDLA
jgi:hypothetical protein